MTTKRDRSGEYARRKEKCIQLKICFRCSNPRGDNKWLCDNCLSSTNNRDKKARHTNKVLGLCECGKPVSVGKQTCATCLENDKAYQTNRRNKHRISGKCLTCGEDPEPGTVTCLKCRIRASNSTLKRYRSFITDNRCAQCGTDTNGKFRCDICHNIHLEQEKINWHKYRCIVIEKYGGKCQCCGSNTLEFLDLDHVDGDGNAHRKVVGRRMVNWAIANNYPSNLQLLCANCNRGKSKFGTCPHVMEPRTPSTHTGRRKRRQRIRVINGYGGYCICCREPNWAFLEFDHVNNDGNIHRKTISHIIPWIIANDYPDTIQLLCSNCNKAKGLYGMCPHQKEIILGTR